MKFVWLIENRVLLIRFDQSISVRDAIDVNQTLITYLENADETMSVIIMADQVEEFPTDISQISRLVTFLKHPNLAWNITVTNNPVYRFIVRVLYRIMGKHTIRFANDYEMAIQILQELDEQLPALPESVD